MFLGCLAANMSKFSVKTTFSKQQLEYGSRHGYDHLILAIHTEDPSKGDYISSMDLRRAINFLQKKVNVVFCVRLFSSISICNCSSISIAIYIQFVQVACEEARDRAKWMKGSLDDYPRLPLPPVQLFQDANAVKSYASKQLNWLLEPLSLKKGKGLFPGWDYQVDRAAFVYSGQILANLSSQSVSLSMLIDWADMADMSSLSSGNGKALKKDTGVKNWSAFCKVLVEMIFIMIEEDPADWYQAERVGPSKKVAKKLVSAKKLTLVRKDAPAKKVNPAKKEEKEEKEERENPFVETTDSDDDFVPVVKKAPAPKAKRGPTKKTNVLHKLKKPEVERGGADFDLQMGIALSISKEEVRNTLIQISL